VLAQRDAERVLRFVADAEELGDETQDALRVPMRQHRHRLSKI